MPKRSNEDSQQESRPAAKRAANQNENEIDIVVKQKLQAARTSLHRLDYKNTRKICTELIDSHCPDPSVPLVMRSLALEKLRLSESSIRDAEEALKLKKSKGTHLRCSFAHLARALYHLRLAQKQPPEDDQEEDCSVSEAEIKEFSHSIKDFKSMEAGNPFKRRISEDLLLHMAPFFDSPSLVMFSATSKGLRSSIQGSKELFRVFKMSGKGENLTDGIKFFSQRCGNSIRSIDIKVEKKLGQITQDLLEGAISLSSSTLGAISICHQGDLCKLIIQVASLSPSLKILSSTNTAGDFSPLNGQLEVSSSWNAKLTKLVWDGGAESLVCNDTLLQSLQSAKEVNIYSRNVRPSWVVDLLRSASSTLISVRFALLKEEDVDEIPSVLMLPNLDNFRLGRPLCSRSTGDSLFRVLHAPNLRSLCLKYFKIADICSIGQGVSLSSFTAFGLLKSDGTLASEAGEEEATSFVEAIKDWKELHAFHLRLEITECSSFYNRLVDLLTPLSQKNLESGGENRFLLPKLRSLTLGDVNLPATATFISAKKLATFVGTRLALWKGFSSDQISSIAAGDLSQVGQKPQGTPFAPVGTYICIRYLEINISLEADDETLSWLKKKVRWLKISHRVASKCPLEQDRRSEEV